MNKVMGMVLGVVFSATMSYCGIIETNENVPASMDNGTGTALDMAEYLFYDGYSTNYTEDVIVGYNNDYVQLTVSEGSKLVCIDGAYKRLYLGRKPGSVGSKLKIIGENSTVQVGPLASDSSYYLNVGFTGSSDNTIEILDGGSLTNAGWLALYSATNPVVELDNNAIFYNYYRAYLGTGYGSTGAKVSIKNGSRFYVMSRAYIGSGRKSTISVNGSGSIFFDGGNLQYDGGNSLVSSEDKGLVKISGYTVLPTDSSSFFGLADGYLAIRASSMDPTVYVKLWNGTAWVQPATLAEAEALGWTKTVYATNAEGLAATGYDYLSGYSVYTGGVSMTPVVPEGTLLIVQ
jgi:hypothetical protein